MKNSVEQSERMFEVLIRRGHLSTSTKRMVLGFMQKWDVDCFRAIIETHLIDDAKMADILSDEYRLPRMTSVRSMDVKPEILAFLPYDQAMNSAILPFEISDKGRLHMVIADPTCTEKMKHIESQTGHPIELFVGPRNEIVSVIQHVYPLSLQLSHLLNQNTPEHR